MEEIFYDELGETLEQIAQSGNRCPIPWSSQGQFGYSFTQSELLKDVSVRAGGGLD